MFARSSPASRCLRTTVRSLSFGNQVCRGRSTPSSTDLRRESCVTLALVTCSTQSVASTTSYAPAAAAIPTRSWYHWCTPCSQRTAPRPHQLVRYYFNPPLMCGSNRDPVFRFDAQNCTATPSRIRTQTANLRSVAVLSWARMWVGGLLHPPKLLAQYPPPLWTDCSRRSVRETGSSATYVRGSSVHAGVVPYRMLYLQEIYSTEQTFSQITTGAWTTVAAFILLTCVSG